MKNGEHMDTASYAVSVAAITSFEWLTWLHEFDGVVLQILGIIWLTVQIYFKFKNRGK